MNSDRPNILLVISDQHNKGVAGCYGDPVIRTPNLDRLAQEGVRFSRAYCNSPLCCPARMSFLTGRNPSQIKSWDNDTPLSSAAPTFAHALVKAGYQTILCGRMHMVGPDQRHGFLKRIFPEVSTMQKAMGDLDNTFGMHRRSMEMSGYGRNPWVMYDDQCVAAACNWLKDSCEASDSNPFCLIVGLVSPHCPYVCTEEAPFRYYLHHVKLPSYSPEYFNSLHPYTTRYRRRSKIDDLSETEKRRTKAAYFAMVEHMDGLLGSLLSALQERQFARNTLVIYTSDHGDMLGEHGLWWKMSYYDGSVAVPLICSWPGRLKSTVCGRLVSLLDVGPTLADLAGCPPIPCIEGRSFKSSLYNTRPVENDSQVFAELFPDVACRNVLTDANIGPTGGPSRMLRKGNWKCIYYHQEAPELYNLSEDPCEMRNRSADPSCQQVLVKMLSEILRDWNPVEILNDAIEQLQQTSYIGIHGHQTDPWDPDFLKDEYWSGAPPDYGCVLASSA